MPETISRRMPVLVIQASRPVPTIFCPVNVSNMPSLPPGGPGRGALFSTSTFPFGETAGIAQLRTGLPTVLMLRTGVFVSRSQVETPMSPPSTSVDPFAETAWQVLHPDCPAAARKSSGWASPGLMRSTRPRLFAQ